MIGSLITSQTRIKILKRFFLNSSTRAHLRGLEAEFGESSNAIRVELNRLESAGLLKSSRHGNKKLYQADRSHPLFNDIHSIILKETGLDRIISKMVSRAGNLMAVYLAGDFASGRDSHIIELILVGTGLDNDYLDRKAEQAGKMVGREVRYTVLTPGDEQELLSRSDRGPLLPLWGERHDSAQGIAELEMENIESRGLATAKAAGMVPATGGSETVIAERETVEVVKSDKIGLKSPAELKADKMQWYAVYTRPRSEKMAAERLRERGFRVWLPLHKTMVQWSDRKKMVEKPLLSSYLFVHCSERELYGVRGTYGVCKIVECRGRPAPIPDNQIENLRMLIDANYKMSISTGEFRKGDSVEVIFGPLTGLKGELVKEGSRKRLVVHLDAIEQNITVTIPPKYLRRL